MNRRHFIGLTSATILGSSLFSVALADDKTDSEPQGNIDEKASTEENTLPLNSSLNIDFDNYSDEEIVSLLKQIQAEIVARKIEKSTAIASGTYIGGVDLPAGSYLLSSPAANDSMTFHLYDANGDFVESDFISSDENLYYVARIEDGGTLEIGSTARNITLTIYTGLKFE